MNAGDGAGVVTPTDTDTLRGRTFATNVITEQGKPRTLVSGTAIELRFTDDGRLVANAGCNTMTGTVTLTGGTLDATDLSITEIGCDPQRHEQDQRLVAFLSGKPSWRLDGDSLVLSSTDAELVLLHDKARPLVGTTWKVDSLIDGQIVGATPAGVVATLVFGQDEVTVTGLCNLRSVPYRISGLTLTFELNALHLKACSQEIMTVEQAAIGVLSGVTTYRIDAGTLTITKGDKGLRFLSVD